MIVRKKLPWSREVFLADVAGYARLGIRRATTFAARADADDRTRFVPSTFSRRHGVGVGRPRA